MLNAKFEEILKEEKIIFSLLKQEKEDHLDELNSKKYAEIERKRAIAEKQIKSKNRKIEELMSQLKEKEENGYHSNKHIEEQIKELDNEIGRVYESHLMYLKRRLFSF